MLERNAAVIIDQTGTAIWLPGLKKSNVEPDIISDEKSLIYLEYKKLNSSWGQLITMTMQNDIEKVLISERTSIEIRELGAQLEADYQGKFPLAIGVLKGAMPFMSDLLKRGYTS